MGGWGCLSVEVGKYGVLLLRSGFVVTTLEKFVFASHLRKPKIHNKAHDFPKPITSQTLLIHLVVVNYWP